MSKKEYNKLTFQEKLALIRFYPKEAKKDEDDVIREEAYEALGFTEEAFKDGNYMIRREAYRALGYTEEALNDKDYHIRQEAKIYLDFIKLNN